MKIAVTGANGHVGLNLVASLVDAGHEIRAFDQSGFEALDGLPVEKFEGDVRDENALARCFEGVDRVFHLAAIISIDGDRDGLVYDVNVDGARVAAHSALVAGVGRFVHFSSIHAFDSHSAGAVLDETATRATGDDFAAYDRSKALGEAEVRGQIAEGLDAVVLHPTGVIGPLDLGPSRAGRGILDAARGRLPVVVNGGFDWVDVRDVISGAQAAAERGRRGQSYILSGTYSSIEEITGFAAGFSGVSKPLVSLPRGLLRSFAMLPTLVGRLRGREPLFTTESLDTLGTRTRFSHQRAELELDYRPRPLKETLRNLVDWFIETGRIPARREERAVGTSPTLQSRFAQQLTAHPVDGPGQREFLARALAEIAVADGDVEVSERALLSQFAEVAPEDLIERPGITADDLAKLTPGQRDSLLLVALALAWVDEEFSAVERHAVDCLRCELGISESRAGELEQWAKEFVLDQLFDAVYADGRVDAEERERIEQTAARLETSPATLAHIDSTARQRRGLPAKS